jgi:hypothetical protein
MPQHRFTEYFQANRFVPSPFVMAPVQVISTMEPWQRDLYQWAYEKAQAVVEPSWVELDVLGVWN